MVCSNCGKIIKDENSFCPYCGSKVEKVEASPAQEEVKSTGMTQEEPVPETPVSPAAPEETKTQTQAETKNPAAYAFSSETDLAAASLYDSGKEGNSSEKGKKKKSAGKILIGILLAVVALGLVGLLLWEPVVGFALRTFAPESYFVYVQSKGMKQGLNALDKAADTALDIKDLGSDATIQLNVGSELQELAKSFGGRQAQELLGWIGNVKVGLETNVSDDLVQFKINLYSSQTKVITADVIFDTDENVIYVSVPDLIEDTLRLDAEEQMDIPDVDEEELPDSSALKSILFRYVEIFLKNLDDVTVEKGSYQLEDGEKGDYVVAVTVTEKDVIDALIEMVKVAKNDEELEDLVEQVAELAGESSEEIPWKSSMNSLLDMLKEAKSDIEEDPELFVYKSYVNGWTNRILGVELIVEELELEGGYFNDGKDVDFYVTQGDTVDMKVTGKTANKTTDLKGSLKVEKKSILNVTAKMGEKQFLLHVEMGDDLKEQLIRELNIEGSGYEKYMDLALELEYTADSKNHTASRLTVLLSGKNLVELKMEETMRKAEKISVPDKKNTTDDIEEWVADLNSSDLEDLLEKANIPSFLY